MDTTNFSKEGLKISVVMMSYLYDYPGARSNPVYKFNRAVQSFLDQKYDNKELIIVSDGCDLTVEEYNSNWKQYDNIKLIYVEKSKFDWPGSRRQIGVDAADGEWIVYLDSDDIIHPDHLSNIHAEIEEDTVAILNNTYTNALQFNITGNPNGWMFLNGFKIHASRLEQRLEKMSAGSNTIDIYGERYFYKAKKMYHNKFGTSRTSHKKDCGVKWIDRRERGEDIIFSEALMRKPHKIINSPTYIVCHVPKRIDI